VKAVATVLSSGDEFTLIDRESQQREVNVVIIGAGRTGSDGRFYLGTTAGELRRRSTKPVWIVPPGSSSQIKKILCPVDFLEASGHALRNAIHLARRFGSELTVLTVIQSLSSYYDMPSDPNDEAHSPLVKTRLREFDRYLRGFDFEGVTWKKAIRPGKPYREILKTAREDETDLLVMGSVGRSGISRLFIGGVARKVAQRMPCSIITVRSEDAVQLHIDYEVPKPNRNTCARRPLYVGCERLKHGKALFEQGFPEEALNHLQECISEYDLCPRAWETLAATRKRLGHKVEAEKCEERARKLEQILNDRPVECDLRENHVLFRSIFGI
jgi:nucleotide-binding universal stress UspA family protein